MEKFWNIWNSNGDIKIGNYTMKGFSVAAFRTNFFIKELSFMFDAGISSPYNPSHIFITHTHSDHIANIPFHLMGRRDTQRLLFCPQESTNHLEQYIKSLFVASNGEDLSELKKNHVTIGVKAGDLLDLTVKGRKLKLEIIKCYHQINCVGYGFIETKRKLKKELLNKPPKELKDISDNEKYDYTSNYEFCYIGDTSEQIFKDGVIDRYSSIIIECTFLFDSELERAVETTHIHWNHLKPFVESHPNNMFYLYHFSARYKPDTIITFFANQNIKNVIILANNATAELELDSTDSSIIIDE